MPCCTIVEPCPLHWRAPPPHVSSLCTPCTCRLLEVLRPLGLPHARLGAARDVALGFLATDWEDPREFKHWCVQLAPGLDSLQNKG